MALLLPSTTAFDQSIIGRATKDATRGSHRFIACDRPDGDVDVGVLGGNRTDTLGSHDVSAFEFDAFGGDCFAA